MHTAILEHLTNNGVSTVPQLRKRFKTYPKKALHDLLEAGKVDKLKVNGNVAWGISYQYLDEVDINGKLNELPLEIEKKLQFMDRLQTVMRQKTWI